jgi:integrase
MHDTENLITTPKRVPWNKGKLIGPRPPLRQKHVWAIRTRLQIEEQVRDLALFNLAIDSKLRGCDVVAVRVDDVAPNGHAVERASVRQRKTGRPVRFELTEQTRQAIDEYLAASGRKPGDYLFGGRRQGQGMTTRQYARLLSDWLVGIGLDPHVYGTHSLRRTKATLIYRRTGNLRAVQLLLGHTKIESTVRYLGIDIDELWRYPSRSISERAWPKGREAALPVQPATSVFWDANRGRADIGRRGTKRRS